MSLKAKISIIEEFKSISTNIPDIEKQIQQLKEDLAELILLYDIPETKSVYNMTYEEQVTLSSRTRL